MQLFTQVPPAYLPETDQESVLRLGIAPLALPDWLQIDADFTLFHRHKRDVLRAHPQRVCLSLPESEAAQDHFTRFLLQTLRACHGLVYEITDAQLTHRSSGLSWATTETALAHSSRWVQEDICLLEPKDGDYILTAASVCSPSNWRLEDKLGRTLDNIHVPVPGYQAELAARVNRLIANLKPDKPLFRFNWSLQRGNELLWRDDMPSDPQSEELFWRVERQSLLRIPDTNIVVFSIRIYLHSIAALRALPGFQTILATILTRLPAAQRSYKGLLDKSLV